MRTSLAVVLVLAAVLSGAPRARGADTAYASLVGIAASASDEREQEAKLPASAPDREKDDGPLVAAPAPRPVSAWTKLFVLLLPPIGTEMPQLRASTSPVVGSRPIRFAPASPAPRETEEGVRRGMAEMLALMSAAPDPLPAGRR